MSVFAVALVASACLQVEPAPAPDPAAAEAYASVGDAELAAGAPDTALVAFREAARLDPANARVHAALEKLCAESPETKEIDPFEEGVRLLEDGDTRAALARFEEARKQAFDAGVALMLGICHYELGEDESARPLLLEAETDEATAKQARLFLGLVALRAGDRAEAASRFANAGSAADPRLSAAAGDLLKLSRRDGRLVVGLALDPRFDTNVALAPDGTPSEQRAPDGALVASMQLSARPIGYGRGLYLGANGLYRLQATQRDYDFGGAGGTVGWEWAARNLAGAVEYGAEGYALGSSFAPYLFAQRVLATMHWTPGRLSLGASYRGRVERFFGTEYEGYSGLRHTFTADATWRFTGGSSVALSWRGERDFTRDRALNYWETGPWAQGTWRAGDDLRLGAQVGVLARDFIPLRESLLAGETPRDDLVLHGELYGEYDVGTHLVLRASVGSHRTNSTDANAAYTNVFGSLGVAWIGGFF